MTTFLPPPADLRCVAIVYRTGWEFTGQRCLQRHTRGSDLCRKHADMEKAGQRVQRVNAPRRVE